MRVLVTGSAGFVGRHVVPKLKALGYDVTAVDGKEKTHGSGRYPDTFQNWLKNAGRHLQIPFDLIVHLAANIDSIDNRLKAGVDVYQDISLDLAMCDYIQKSRPKCVVWPTSCATDYDADPYAFCKIAGERFFGALVRDGIDVKILRPYSGYGSDQAQTYPFPAILKRAMEKKDPLEVWGSLDTVRDFVHIDDLSDAFIHAIDNFPSGVPMPIGTGIGTSMGALAAKMVDAVGYQPDIVALADKPAASPRRVADTTLARKYGWEAKVTLEQGIAKSIEELSR